MSGLKFPKPRPYGAALVKLLPKPYYQDEAGIFAIDTIELIGGSLPQRQHRLVEAWAEIHQTELLAAWERLQTGQLPGRIEPLR